MSTVSYPDGTSLMKGEVKMPRGNGMGPRGMGPMTGRGAGFCAGTGMPGFANPIPGRGFGMGFGYGMGRGFAGAGRGRRNMFFATGMPGWTDRSGWVDAQSQAGIEPETEKQILRNQLDSLKTTLDTIQKRLDQLEQSSSSENNS